VDFEYVLVDYGLVLQAAPNLNTAGLGDVLCGHAGFAEWRCNSKLGIGPPYDEAQAQATLDYFEEIPDGFERTLDADRRLTESSVRFIMSTIQERDHRVFRHPAMPPTDHEFDFATEQANDRGLVHGEACALGAVLTLWHTDENPEGLIEALDRCQVRFRPRDIGLSKVELGRGLEELPRWLTAEVQGRDHHSVMRRERVVGPLLDECWAWLESI
jgi:glycerol dehydrogenase-like iron-containing ADH family enzyme